MYAPWAPGEPGPEPEPGRRLASGGPVRAGLRELLTPPFELVLPTHGPPADRAAFARAVD